MIQGRNPSSFRMGPEGAPAGSGMGKAGEGREPKTKSSRSDHGGLRESLDRSGGLAYTVLYRDAVEFLVVDGRRHLLPGVSIDAHIPDLPWQAFTHSAQL